MATEYLKNLLESNSKKSFHSALNEISNSNDKSCKEFVKKFVQSSKQLAEQILQESINYGETEFDKYSNHAAHILEGIENHKIDPNKTNVNQGPKTSDIASRASSILG